MNDEEIKELVQEGIKIARELFRNEEERKNERHVSLIQLDRLQAKRLRLEIELLKSKLPRGYSQDFEEC